MKHWVQCERTYRKDIQCRQCKSSETYCRDRLIYTCECTDPIHEECLVDEIFIVQQQSPERLKSETGGEGFWVYSCSFCKGPILFYNDFSNRLIPCHQRARVRLAILIAIMVLIVIAGFILPCFILSAVVESQVCWVFIGLVVLILIGLSYLLFDCMTTVFFRKAKEKDQSTVSTKEIMTLETKQEKNDLP